MPFTNNPPPDGATLVLCAPTGTGRWRAVYEHGFSETHVLMPPGVHPPKVWSPEAQADIEAAAAANT